jgi:hypothetical protein
MSSSFQRIVTRETVLSFGIKPYEWDDEDQADLHESMILCWKENPDWTDEEATEACRDQVDRILFRNFERTYKYLLSQVSDLWRTPEKAYIVYVDEGKRSFEEQLNEHIEYLNFCKEFYDDLREMWNIDTAGMYEAFQKMKKNDWTHTQYRNYIQEQRAAKRNTQFKSIN